MRDDLSQIAQGPQIAEVVGQGVAIMRLQGVVFHHVLQVIDRIVQLPLVKMIAAQFAVELRKMMLDVFIARPLFLVVSREIRGPFEIVLNARYQISGAIELLAVQHPTRSAEHA